MIAYIACDTKIPFFPRRIISNWIKKIVLKYQKRIGDISYIFCSEEKMLDINREYLSHNYLTDIITFDYTENNCLSGDVFIGTSVVRSNAKKYRVTFENELYRVMIHGILHLCGINDKTEIERSFMEYEENEALIQLENMNFITRK